MVNQRKLSRSIFALLIAILFCVGARTASSRQRHQSDAAQLISDLALYNEEAISFQNRPIPSAILRTVLNGVVPNVTLSQWRLIAVQDKDNRIGVLEAMQTGFRRLGREDLARAVERWKTAPLLLIFCMPKTVEAFGGVPPASVYPQALVELGWGTQDLALIARAYGLETHWVAGAVLVNPELKRTLKIPVEYEVISFAVAGYPEKLIQQNFPPLEAVAFGETWGRGFK
jgi:nitroreductase